MNKNIVIISVLSLLGISAYADINVQFLNCSSEKAVDISCNRPLSKRLSASLGGKGSKILKTSARVNSEWTCTALWNNQNNIRKGSVRLPAEFTTVVFDQKAGTSNTFFTVIPGHVNCDQAWLNKDNKKISKPIGVR